MATKEFWLPDLGEGLTEGEILQWLVQVGDEVTLNQPIVEVETAKAAVEVPSPYAGVVTALHHAAGETVAVGTPIISFGIEPGGQSPVAELAAAANPHESVAVVAEEAVVGTPRPDEPVEPGVIGGPAPGERTSVLVGYGPRPVTARRRPRRPTAPSAPSVHAKPPVRKLARDLGVDLSALPGTGQDGTITRADVEAAAAPQAQPPMSAPVAPPVPFPAPVPPPPAPTPAALPPPPAAPAESAAEPAGIAALDPGTRERRIPIKSVHRAAAAAVVASAFTAPHVTEFLTVDVTPMVQLRDRLAARAEFQGVKVTPLLLVAKALLLAVRRAPMVNSTWDDAVQEIVVKDYVNLGIAASTPRGLVVPNIKDAGRRTLPELARAIQDLTVTAREGRTPPADMLGGTITITNVGVFGVDAGTPILNPGEAAILCFGAVRDLPWVYEGEIAVRKVTQLALSFDHRVVDGDLGSRFLADIGQLLSDPDTYLAWS